MKNATETEVKIRLVDRAATQENISRAGLAPSVPRIFEANALYDTRDRSLREREMILRLRQVGDSAVITWKGPDQPGPYKSRAELETSIGSYEALHQILVNLGYDVTFRYEKFRTEFAAPGKEGVVTLDETPIGDFLELEGPGKWIDETASQLGFGRKDYILDSYARLYLADCERRGVEPTHMVFASHS